MAKIDVSQVADIRAIMGASGSGKSTYVKRETAKAGRLVVWDPEDEYGGQAEEVPLSHLAQALRAKSFRVRVVPPMRALSAAFDVTCGIAFHTGGLVFVAEELRFVTTPSRAPARWAETTLRGRKRGVKIYGLSQRPASIDKDFLFNATIVRAGTLQAQDAAAVSLVTGVPAEEYMRLDNLEWIEWAKAGRIVTRGKLKF